jgi:hypothetical protein
VIQQKLSEDTPIDVDKALAGGGLLKFPISLDRAFKVLGPISLKDQAAEPPPEHLPEYIAAAFREGATCVVVKCWNAAGVMFAGASIWRRKASCRRRERPTSATTSATSWGLA